MRFIYDRGAFVPGGCWSGNAYLTCLCVVIPNKYEEKETEVGQVCDYLALQSEKMMRKKIAKKLLEVRNIGQEDKDYVIFLNTMSEVWMEIKDKEKHKNCKK